MEMTYRTTLKKVGNSRALIIPASILKKHGVGENSPIVFEEKEGYLEVRFPSRHRSFFAPLRKAAELPGAEMSMEDIRAGRSNKEIREW